MSVVAGDRQEGDKEDVILIQEEDTNQNKKKNSGASIVAKSPGIVLSVGLIIFITTVLVWSASIPYYQEARPMFWVLVGLLLIFHGLIGLSKTPESFVLDIAVNGKQLSHTIPLRLALVTVA